MKFFAMFFMLLGVTALMFGARIALEGWQAKSWPEAKGRIVLSKVTELRTSKNIRVARLCVTLDYLYMVGQKIYEGHRLNSGWRCFASENRVRQIMERYPVGKAVTVRYNPKNPEISMLEPGLNWTAFMLLGVGVINCSVALPLMKRGMRRA